MYDLKHVLYEAPALAIIEYGEDVGEIIVIVNASRIGFGIVLMQVGRDGKRYPIRFNSGL